MGIESFTVVKLPGRGVDHPPASRVGVKERAQLYLDSPSGPSRPVLGRPLPLRNIIIYSAQQLLREYNFRLESGLLTYDAVENVTILAEVSGGVLFLSSG